MGLSKIAPTAQPEPVTSLVTPEDLPALVEAELLTFTGINTRDALARRIHPFRADLVRKGIPVRRWPDFESTLRKYDELLKNEAVVMIKAEIKQDSENENRNVPIGMAYLRLPKSKQSFSGPKGVKETALEIHKKYVKPTLKGLSTLISGSEADGTDYTFWRMFVKEVIRGRKELENDTGESISLLNSCSSTLRTEVSELAVLSSVTASNYPRNLVQTQLKVFQCYSNRHLMLRRCTFVPDSASFYAVGLRMAERCTIGLSCYWSRTTRVPMGAWRVEM